MASTYTPIATTTLGSAQSSVTFSSIPSTYTDLVLIVSAKNTSASQNYGYIYFNSDTGSNYSRTVLTGDGSSAASARFSNSIVLATEAVAGKAVQTVNIMNYSNTTTYKTMVGRDSNNALVGAFVSLWRSTAAINTVTCTAYTANFDGGSTFTLYGIASA